MKLYLGLIGFFSLVGGVLLLSAASMPPLYVGQFYPATTTHTNMQRSYSSFAGASSNSFSFDNITLTGSNFVNQTILTNLSLTGGYIVSTAHGPATEVNGATASLLIFSNSWMSGVTVSNGLANISQNYAVAGISNWASPFPVANWDNVTIYSGDWGALLHNFNANCRGLRIVAKSNAVETRTGAYRFYGSSFQSLGGNSADDYSRAFAANDTSTNYLYGCELIAASGASQNTIMVLWAQSASYFYNCSFKGAGTTASAAGGFDGAMDIAEDGCYAQFNHCTFDLAYTNGLRIPLLFFDSGNAQRTVEFNDCYVFPETNGIIANLSNMDPTDTIKVRGGNLKASNFSDPSKVTFLPYAKELVSGVLQNAIIDSTVSLCALSGTTATKQSSVGRNCTVYTTPVILTNMVVRRTTLIAATTNIAFVIQTNDPAVLPQSFTDSNFAVTLVGETGKLTTNSLTQSLFINASTTAPIAVSLRISSATTLPAEYYQWGLEELHTKP